MRFQLIDRIVEVEPGKRLRAVKNLTLGEEYLADHFPTFPVMPGVLMLQSLVEAGSWLLRATEDFRYSTIVLRQAKNVKYGSFMEPGKQLVLEVELQQFDQGLATFKGKGETEGRSAVSARFTLYRSNLAQAESNHQADGAQIDQRLQSYLRERFAWLCQGIGKLATNSTVVSARE
jgi:3-hydroxyacyl-[acyl-carrier-protein] dehydratase